MAATSILFLIFSLLLLNGGDAHNITEILAADPDLSQFNDYLTRTKLADEINSRQTITVLALNNAAMSSLTSGHPLSVIKNLLSLHVLLDYFDPKKLHSIPSGTVLSTTLYQTTGVASGNVGFVNVTDLKGGAVGFGSGAPGSKLDSRYTKSVKQIPYNISVVEISAPIIAPALLTAPAPSPSDLNITALLEKAGCKTFASLIASSGVLKFYQAQMDKGLTIFAPNDEAFKAKGVPDMSKLSNAELVSLLQFHAISTYAPTGTLKTTKDPLPTLAGTGKYSLTASSAGDSVTLHTGVDSSRVASTVLDATPVAIFTVDNVLLPQALFGTAPTPAPAPAPESATPAPAPAPKAKSPAPAKSPASSPLASPPAPTADTPAGGPAADVPTKAADDNSTNAAEGSAPAVVIMAVALSVASGVISLVL